VTGLRAPQAAELRQLRRELPARPWLAPRVAELLLAAGRPREALTLLRKTARSALGERHVAGWMVLAEVLERAGAEGEAEQLRERACRATAGIHAAWLQRLQASREDSLRHLELLRAAWELDQFSAQLNRELEQSGLRRAGDYEQALRPTAAEAARRERQFRRLLEQHAARRNAEGAMSAEVDSTPEVVSDEVSDTSLAQPSTVADSGPALVPEVEAAAVATVQDLPAELDTADGPVSDEVSDEVSDTVLAQVSTPRDRDLSEQAGRLESLTRPLGLPRGLPEDPTRRVAARAADLFDPRSMLTRRLARIYLEQGYPALALQTLAALRVREPAAADLPMLEVQARELERRLAEAAPATRRRRN
jgi:hypothetical protein